MAGGAFAVEGEGRNFHGKLTASVIITCIVAASGGLIFGYDIGISGGVSTMEPFLAKFFPSVLQKTKSSSQNLYCTYDSQILTAFTSSLYIAGLVASLTASHFTRSFGHRAIMLAGGFMFLMGSTINSAAVNIVMLILGRILLGLGVGFTNQATPIYISEMAPAKWRGAFSTGFQFCIGLGVVAANLINYFSSHAKWGWRISLGLAGAPAIFIVVGVFIISDTPTSLVQRGKIKQARLALQRVRGANVDIEEELEAIVRQNEISRHLEEETYRNIIRPQYRPHLVMAVSIPVFQQLTGINIIAFYAPILFQTVGFGNNSALLAAVILGAVNIFSILVSTFVVDRCGRRALFLQGGIQMFICQVVVACTIAKTIGVSGEGSLSKGVSVFILIMICIYGAGFGWSWGPLSWLVPSEIFPSEIRSAGQSIAVAMNFIATFVLAQTFLTSLCHLKYGLFIFYAVWIMIMTIFIGLLLPETKGIPLESMQNVWVQHWFWKKFVSDTKIMRHA